MKRNLIFYLLILNGTTALSQNLTAIDSLRNLLQNSSQDTIRALALRELCIEYRNINSDSSLVFGQQALSLSEKIDFPRGQARSFGALAGTYRLRGDVPKAWECSNKSLKIANEHNLYLEQALCYNMIGVIYGDIGDEAKEAESFRIAIGINAQALGDKLKSEVDAVLLNNLGVHFLTKKQADSALVYFQRILTIPSYSITQSPLHLSNLGQAKVLKGEKESGFADIRNALRLATEDHRLDIASAVHRALADCFMDIKQFDSAVFHSKKGLSIAKSLKLTLGIHRHARNLVALYDTVDVRQAYFYLNLADSTNEELRGKTKNAKMLSSLLEEQERQNQERVAKEAEQTRFKQLIFIGAVVLLLLIVGALVRFNRKEKKAKLLLEAKNKEIQATQSQLIQSEKMASLGELTAGIAHEIQNPLNFVNNFSEVSTELVAEMNAEIDKGNTDEAKEIANDLKQNLEKINHHGKRAGDIVKGMLQHSRSSSGVKEPTDINALADEYLRLAYHGLRAKDKSFNATMKTDFDESIGKVNVIPQDIGRVILNLITNGFYVVNEKSKQGIVGYEPTVTVSTKKDGNKVLISVKDNGNGIPKKMLDKIFQPFFTTKPTGQGTGLGLSLSYDIVKAHGGELKVETEHIEGLPAGSSAQAGSEFIIQLPD